MKQATPRFAGRVDCSASLAMTARSSFMETQAEALAPAPSVFIQAAPQALASSRTRKI
jgi:hypothetical protein